MNLLAIAAPLVIAFIKRHVTSSGLNAGGLASLLMSQKDALAKSGLDSRITGALGFPSVSSMLSSLGGAASSTAAAATTMARDAGATVAGAGTAAAATASSGLRRWLPWIIGAIILFLLWTMLGRQPAQVTKPTATPPATTTAPATTPAPAPAVTATVVTSGLPATVYFEVDQAAIPAASTDEIARAAAAIKGGAKVAITGYTDATGDPAKNQELAKNRATAVKDALVKAGAPEGNITMAPPASVTGGGEPRAARRVEINKQ